METDVRRELTDLRAGRIGPVNEVILEISGTTTTVTTRSCSETSYVALFPVDAGGASEFVSGWLYTTPGNGSFVITHTASVGQRTFRWVVLTGINYQ